jgi:hypothetical protein
MKLASAISRTCNPGRYAYFGITKTCMKIYRLMGKGCKKVWLTEYFCTCFFSAGKMMLNDRMILIVSNNVKGALVACLEACPGICLERVTKCIINLLTNVWNQVLWYSDSYQYVRHSLGTSVESIPFKLVCDFEETYYICLFLGLCKDSAVNADVTQLWMTTKIGILI